MGKSKKFTLPVAPWLFVHDPTPGALFASRLTRWIPRTTHIFLDGNIMQDEENWTRLAAPYCAAAYKENVIVFSDARNHSPDGDKKVLSLRNAAAENSCNFASINLYRNDEDKKKGKWGANHLDIKLDQNSHEVGDTEIKTVADKIWHWLFKTFTIKETLHLISDEKMRKVDDVVKDWDRTYGHYQYCPIADICKKPKDARIQIVALILTKPEVHASKRLSWQVVDKTGVATFYFQHRGPESDYTWNWVLGLKPGQRKCLPRMPCVQVKENPFVTIAKSPFRITGAVIGGTGRTVKSIGRGLDKFGKKLKMGSRVKWVPEADYEDQQKKKATTAKTTPENSEQKRDTEKDTDIWKDDDSVASTTAGSIFDEKKEVA